MAVLNRSLITNTGSIALCGGSFAKNCGLIVGSNGEVKISMNGILAIDNEGKNYVRWVPTKDGDWLMRTSIANGGNIRDVKGYYGNTATITDTINTNILVANTMIAKQGITFNENILVSSGKSVVFGNKTGDLGAY